MSEHEATSDKMESRRWISVRTSGCFGQNGASSKNFCPNMELLRTKWIPTDGFLSEHGATSDKMECHRWVSVRTWGYFGQNGSPPMDFCPNMELLRTKWRPAEEILSEHEATSDKIEPRRRISVRTWSYFGQTGAPRCLPGFS